MAKQNLLLVDDNVKSRRVLEVSLRNAGYAVTTASDGAEALEKLSVLEPVLIISDTGMPNLDGLALCASVRANPRSADTPFIFLTDDASVATKVKGLELGADDFLVRPIYLTEVVGRVRMLLQRQERVELEAGQRRFFGQLEELSVVDLLQTFEQGGKSAAVVIHGPQTGRIWFADGAVVDAEAGQSRADQAIYRLLTWQKGRFEVDFTTVDRIRHVHASVSQLLMEGMGRVDEWGRMREQLPALETVFEVDYGELAERLDDLPAEVNDLLRLFDGRRSALEVVDDSGLEDLAALAAISRLYFEGILYAAASAEPAPPPAPAVAEPQRANLSRWLSEAPETPAPNVVSAIPMALPPVETASPRLVDDLLATAQAMPGTPVPRRAVLTELATIQAPASVERAPEPPAEQPVPVLPSVVVTPAPVLPSVVVTPAPVEPAPQPAPFERPAAGFVSDVAPTIPLPSVERAGELLAAEASLTDHAHEEAFFVDSQHDMQLPPDFMQGTEAEHEPMPKAAWFAIGLLVLAVLGGGLFFGLRDTLEPRVEPRDAIDGTWHQRMLSKKAKLGPVAPIEASWQPDIPAPKAVVPAVDPDDEDDDDDSDEPAEAATPAGVAPKVAEPAPKVEPEPVEPAPAGAGFDALLAEGLKLYEAEKYKAALAKFEQALGLKPNNSKAMIALANTQMEMGQDAQALSTAKKVVKFNPQGARAHLIIGTVLQSKGQTEAAVEAYGRYLKLAPNGPYAREVQQVLQGLK
jgi:CheY-like chemotaxis protein